MRTITLEQPGNLRLSETPGPQKISGEQALVRVRRIGICGTDIHAFRGKQPFFSYPRILGHELGVEIIEIGSNERGLAAGDRCAVEPYLNCENCIACRRGKPNCCAKLQVLGVHVDGGMRDLIALPIRKLHKSAVLSLEQLALIETLGIGAHAVQRACLQAGECVLVVGAGPIGLSVIQFARLANVKLIVLDVNEQRLSFCRGQMNVEHSIQKSSAPAHPREVLDRLSALTDGDMPTAVFDATGNATSMAESFSYVAPGGRLVYVGLFQGEIAFNDPDFHRRELSILATRNSTPSDFTRIIALVEAGQIDTTPWITHRASCEEMIGCFPNWLEPKNGVLKAIVEWN